MRPVLIVQNDVGNKYSPTVIAAAIISVNSMLFSSRNQIKGLTTSMGLWATGIIGLTAGAGLYTVTLVSFAALLCCLSLFPAFETYLKNRSNHFEVHLELKSSEYLQDFVTTIRRLGLFIDADYTILTVTDTGRGMSPDIRAHLFEKGVSTKGGEHGRGLFLVKELVEKYHGTIDVDTE